MTDPQPPVPPVPPVPPASGANDAPPPPAAAPAQPTYPAYGQAAPGTYGPPTNTLAIVAMVLSLAGLVIGITAIVGAILGHVALGQIKRTGEGGRPFALTGIIAGWIITGFWILFVIAYAIFFVVMFSTYGISSSF